MLDPRVVGEEHYQIAEEIRRLIEHYRELTEIISLLGMDELSRRPTAPPCSGPAA